MPCSSHRQSSPEMSAFFIPWQRCHTGHHHSPAPRHTQLRDPSEVCKEDTAVTFPLDLGKNRGGCCRCPLSWLYSGLFGTFYFSSNFSIWSPDILGDVNLEGKVLKGRDFCCPLVEENLTDSTTPEGNKNKKNITPKPMGVWFVIYWLLADMLNKTSHQISNPNLPPAQRARKGPHTCRDQGQQTHLVPFPFRRSPKWIPAARAQAQPLQPRGTVLGW